MARITLFRHAKAETPAMQKSDFDRVLSNRGRRNADIFYFPTSCLADIGFDAPKIGEIESESGRLMSLVRVRDLPDDEPL